MSCNTMLPLAVRNINHRGAVVFYHPMTEWMFCTGMDEVRTAFRIRERSSADLVGRPAYQYADVVTDSPEAWTPVGISVDGVSWDGDTIDLSTTNDDHFWIRFGVESEMQTAGAATGSFELVTTFKQCGTYHGARTVSLQLGAAYEFVEPITGLLSAVGMSKVKAAFDLTTSSTDVGALRYGLAYRTFTDDPDVPGVWQEVGTTLTADTSGARLITDQSVTTTLKQWIQFGILYDLSSAGHGQAELTCHLATR